MCVDGEPNYSECQRGIKAVNIFYIYCKYKLKKELLEI